MTTTATATAKSLTNDEIKLLNDFTNTVNARNINSANEVQKLLHNLQIKIKPLNRGFIY